MPRHPALILILAALAAPAAAEAAVPTVDYKVVIDGQINYNRADVDEDATAQHDEAVDFRTTIPRYRFFGDVAEDSVGALGTATVTRGSYVINGESVQVRCHEHDVGDVTAGGFDATPGEDRNIFATRVIDSVLVNVGGCDLPSMGTWPLAMGSGGVEVGVGMFDGTFTMPHSRIGEASMRFPLAGAVTGSSCPLNHAKTALCSLTWSATVTFTRTGEGEEEIDVPFVPLDAKARLSEDLGRASLPLRCADACRGAVTAVAAGQTLARDRFFGDAGETVRAVVRFDAADRRAIRRAGRVKLNLRAAGVRRTVTLRAR